MYTEFDKKLVSKFIERNYPVSRVKFNMRFKRAIVLDNGRTFLLTDKNSYESLRKEVTKSLEKIFSYNYKFLKQIVDEFFVI